ncbi:MAG: hypothetical protein ABW199_05990, partial [Caulobacterales bacterium]
MTIAALLLPFALLQAEAAPDTVTAPPVVAHSSAYVPSPRLEQCVASIEADAAKAYEDAMAWAADTRELAAYRCAGLALIAQGRNEEGARRLESAAISAAGNPPSERAETLAQAGAGYMLARAPARARSAYSQAIALMQNDRDVMPDLLIDRATAYALEEDWRHSEEDLSRALDLRPNDSVALRLRATARMNQNVLELAEADAQRAVTADPSSVEARLV